MFVSSQAYRHCLPPVFPVPSCLCAIDYVLPPVACWAESFEVLCAANECFWEHEWDCHGSCSGLTQQDYFQETLNLHSQYDISVGALSCQAHVLFGTATRACVALFFDTEWASPSQISVLACFTAYCVQLGRAYSVDGMPANFQMYSTSTL